MEHPGKTKKIGLLAATALGISSIIGSGWLFAPYKASMVAGPAALVAWIVAAVIIILLGLCFSEIAGLYPKRGLSAIIPSLSHNKYFAFPFALSNWLGIIAVVALEADATIQYLINLSPRLESLFFVQDKLTINGDMLSIGLVFCFGLLNFWGVKVLIKSNNIFATFKVLIPLFVGLVMITRAFHPANFTLVNHSFFAYGYPSIFTAILSTGIIVAFNGFQTVISFSSEIKQPGRTIPRSIVIAVVFCLLIYLLLQVSFIGAIPPQMLTHMGWGQLSFNAPVVQLMGAIGLGFFSTIVYFGATVSPSGSAIAFTGTATRMFTAMSRNGQMPSYFNTMNPHYGISRRSLALNTLLAVVFLIVFRSWGQLAEVLSLFHVMSYLPVPIALCVLRNKISTKKYVFRVPFGKTIALFVFIFFTYLFSLADLRIVEDLMMILFLFQVAFILVACRKIAEVKDVFNQSWPLLAYFVILFLLTLSSPTNHHWFSNIEFFFMTSIVSAFLFVMLLKTCRNDVEIIESSVSIYNVGKVTS